jgi:hypothetical protein
MGREEYLSWSHCNNRFESILMPKVITRMNAASNIEVIQKFRDNVGQGIFPEDMKVVFRIAGGLPSQRLEEEFILSGKGEANVKALDMLTSKPPKTVFANLTQEEASKAFRKIEASLSSMITRSEARFPPDSVVGSVTIEVGDENVTLYFPVEDEGRKEVKRAGEKELILSPIQDTIQYFRESSRKLLKNAKEGA